MRATDVAVTESTNGRLDSGGSQTLAPPGHTSGRAATPRAPHAGPVTSRGIATRSRLLVAAEEVFGEGGFDQTSIAEITRRAGVAQGTFYLYFPSKTTIFSELVRQFGRDVRRRIQESLAGLTDRLEIERRGFETFFDYVREHPSIYRIVRQAEFVDRDAFRDYYESFAEGYASGLRAAGKASGVRKLDPEIVAWCLMGMGDLVGIRWILLRDEGRVPSKVLDTMMSLISEGLSPKPKRAKPGRKEP